MLDECDVELHGLSKLWCMLYGAFDWWSVGCWGLCIILVAVVCMWCTSQVDVCGLRCCALRMYHVAPCACIKDAHALRMIACCGWTKWTGSILPRGGVARS